MNVFNLEHFFPRKISLNGWFLLAFGREMSFHHLIIYFHNKNTSNNTLKYFMSKLFIGQWRKENL